MWLFVWDVPSYYSLRVVSETCGSDFFTFAKFYLLTSKWPVAKLHLLAAQRERPSRSAFLFFSLWLYVWKKYDILGSWHIGNAFQDAFHYPLTRSCLSCLSCLLPQHWVTNSELEDFYTEVGAVLVVRAPVRSCCDCHCDRCDRYTCWVRCWVSSTDTVGHPEKSTLGWHKVSVYVH